VKPHRNVVIIIFISSRHIMSVGVNAYSHYILQYFLIFNGS